MRPEAGPAGAANPGTGERQFHDLLKYSTLPRRVQAAFGVFAEAIPGLPLPVVLRPEELAALVMIGRHVVEVILSGARP